MVYSMRILPQSSLTVFLKLFFFLIKNKTKTNIMCILKLSVLHTYTEGKVQHEKKRAALSMDSQYSLAIIQTVVLLNAELLAYLPCWVSLFTLRTTNIIVNPRISLEKQSKKFSIFSNYTFVTLTTGTRYWNKINDIYHCSQKGI